MGTGIRVGLACLVATLVACETGGENEDCAERCGGECVLPCPDWAVRDVVSCACEPRCGDDAEWIEDRCVPLGGDSDTDTDTDSESDSDTDSGGCTNDWQCEGECVSARCVDHRCEYSPIECRDDDDDGYSPDASVCCEPFDCDDSDPEVTDSGSRGCYSGPPETRGVGVCVGGTETCDAWGWGYCEGEVTPWDEWCNGTDEDCDGLVDEDGVCG